MGDQMKTLRYEKTISCVVDYFNTYNLDAFFLVTNAPGHTLLCVIVGGSQVKIREKKTPQVHLIIKENDLKITTHFKKS